jgi:hypothetical protein
MAITTICREDFTQADGTSLSVAGAAIPSSMPAAVAGSSPYYKKVGDLNNGSFTVQGGNLTAVWSGYAGIYPCNAAGAIAYAAPQAGMFFDFRIAIGASPGTAAIYLRKSPSGEICHLTYSKYAADRVYFDLIASGGVGWWALSSCLGHGQPLPLSDPGYNFHNLRWYIREVSGSLIRVETWIQTTYLHEPWCRIDGPEWWCVASEWIDTGGANLSFSIDGASTASYGNSQKIRRFWWGIDDATGTMDPAKYPGMRAAWKAKKADGTASNSWGYGFHLAQSISGKLAGIAVMGSGELDAGQVNRAEYRYVDTTTDPGLTKWAVWKDAGGLDLFTNDDGEGASDGSIPFAPKLIASGRTWVAVSGVEDYTHCVQGASNTPAWSKLVFRTSTDDGVTWTDPVVIPNSLQEHATLACITRPGWSAWRSTKGRWIVPYHRAFGSDAFLGIAWSDAAVPTADDWHLSEWQLASTALGEPMACEFPDGTIRVQLRANTYMREATITPTAEGFTASTTGGRLDAVLWDGSGATTLVANRDNPQGGCAVHVQGGVGKRLNFLIEPTDGAAGNITRRSSWTLYASENGGPWHVHWRSPVFRSYAATTFGENFFMLPDGDRGAYFAVNGRVFGYVLHEPYFFDRERFGVQGSGQFTSWW